MQVTALFAEAAAFARTLPPGAGSDAFVTDTGAAEAVKTTLALMIAGYTPILGAKPHHLAAIDAPAFAWTHDGSTASIAAVTLEDLGNAPAFCTSGSTGDGAIIRKTWGPLRAEAAFLCRLTGLAPGGLVVSLVPPVHIFGFLYGVMLPIAAGADVIYATYDASILSDADLVVAVPALWPALNAALETSPIPLIISSGAPWDAAREAEFLAQKSRKRSSTRLLDVLGSTETGGLGWREVGVPPANVFRAFDGVELAPDLAGSFRLRSPYSEPAGAWATLADEFVLSSDDKRFFVYKGRRDRVFKHGGRRYDLGEIERHLGDIVGGAPVRCRFRDDPTLPKGGELIAYVATAELDYAATRRAYLGRYETPFPTRIFLVDAFQANAAGKVAFPELESKARRSLP